MKTMIDGMSLGKIRVRLEFWGITLTDEQFDNLTYRELKNIYKKAEKIANLKKDIAYILTKHEPKETKATAKK